ncbi:MAG: hypothetical protein Q9220_000008 [cf. Caloplaca sp. 1 TL-2023]
MESAMARSSESSSLKVIVHMKREMKTSQEKAKLRFEMLEKEITRLRLESEGRWLREETLPGRRQFIDRCQRHRLKILGIQGTDAIEASNMAAHDGNALSDAYVFKHDNRSDHSTYSHLYGFQFFQVLNYFEKGIDGGILSVVNAHATLLMSNVDLSPELKEVFRNFIILAENTYPATPMDDEKGELTKAYLDFWRLHAQHKN